MRRILLLSILALSLSACLRVPPQPPARDAGLDAGPTPDEPPRVLAIDVSDRHAGSYSPSAIPQNPIVRVTLSEAPADEPPPIWLFTGAPDADLLDDLGQKPLRASTMDRAVAAELEGGGTSWVLSPDAPLEAGSTVTLGVAEWLRGERTDLTMAEPYALALRVSDAPEAGARVTASWPPDGAAAVPPSMARLAIRFDGPIDGIRDGVTLVEDDGALVPGLARPIPCALAGWPDGTCASFEPDRALAPGSVHHLRVSDSVVDATGAAVGPWEASFTTAADDDDPPPSLVALACGMDEQPLDAGGCVLADDAHLVLRLQATEPVRIAFTIAGRTLLDVASRGSAVLAVDALPPDTELMAALRMSDLAEHTVELPAVLHTTEPLATVSIVEVRSDPVGPEPRQEYVEVLNYGAVPLDLAGLSLSDRADSIGDVVMRSQLLAPGQRALLVADDFDPDDASDDAVPAAVPLVRMGRSLATSGITNGGEPLFLRDAAMRRLSATPSIETGAGRCIVRTGSDPRADFAPLFSVEPCTPGAAPAP